jgi:hypothetical protein
VDGGRARTITREHVEEAIEWLLERKTTLEATG